MQFDSVAASNTNTAPSSAASLAAKQLKLTITLLLIFIVWAYARFGGPQIPTRPQQVAVETFARPMPFIAAPGAGFERVNAREGPGVEYSVRQEFSRGTVLMGISRRWDQANANWIELEGGAGYVKESVLAAASDARQVRME